MEHADKVIDLYDDEKHRHVADLLNQDPKTIASVCGSISTWMLGYPDRALRLNDEKDGYTEPESDQALLLQMLKLSLPGQPPPTIMSDGTPMSQ